jgi:N-acetyl-anhydromuramyl-L-alanine amidase AmpD
VRGLILHATAGSAESDHRIFMGWESKHPVSIHYYILKTGEIRQYVREVDTAWHTGDSAWHGYTDFGCNEITIGTELENLNTGSDPYPQAQYDAAVSLWRELLIPTYSIPREWCARHLDISPGRKTDPAGFPWSQFLDACYAQQHGYERHYRVRFNRSVVREGPARSYPIVSYVNAGTEFWADSLKFGESIDGSDEWIHATSGKGFISATAVERIS